MKTLTIKFIGEPGSGKSLAIKILKEKGFNIVHEETEDGAEDGAVDVIRGYFYFTNPKKAA